MTEQNKDLIVSIDPENAMAVYSKPNGLDPYLQKIRAEVESFVPDMTTEEGRKAIASTAYKVAKSKTYLDNLGKSLTDDWAKKKKVVDTERRRVREELDALKDSVRKPLTEWEDAEKQRKERLNGIHQWLRHAGGTQDEFGQELSSEHIAKRIEDVEAVVVDDSFAEYMAAATKAKSEALESLASAKVRAEKREADARELEELRRKQAEQERKDREEQIAREAAENAKREAEQAAQKREAAAKEDSDRIQREHEQKEAQHKAEIKAAKEREERAAQAERDRIEQQRAEEKAETEKREKDRAHQKAIHGAIIEDLAAIGISEDQAKAIITAIRKGKVRNINLVY